MSYFRVPSFLNRSRDEANQQDNRGLVPQYVGGAGAEEEDEDFYATGSVQDENSQTLTDTHSAAYDTALRQGHHQAAPYPPPQQYEPDPNYGHVCVIPNNGCIREITDHSYLHLLGIHSG
ncbi:hypothetical protein EON64_12770, partial [archaeon]